MPAKVLWEEMLPDEVEEAVAERPVAWLPFGCLERHGPHMALGNDAVKAHGICVLAARRCGGIVWPPSYVHVGGDEVDLSRRWLAQSGNPKLWGPFFPPELVYSMFLLLLRQLEVLGFHAVVAVTGHYGGPEHDMAVVAERFMEHSPLRVRALSDADAIDCSGIGGDHAGRTETSQLLHLRPDLVDVKRLPADRSRPPLLAGADAYEASAALGRDIVESQVRVLATAAQGLLADYRPWPGHETLSTAATMQLWQDLWTNERARFRCRP
ncbi:MAG: creatininase family protein [Anaerolineae bacterium]